MKKYFILLVSFIPIACVTKENKKDNVTIERRMMQTKTKGEGKSLVLVPGGLTGWVSWDPFVDYFASSRKVVQVQLLNVEYGLENKPLPEGYSVRTESEALAASLASLITDEKADFIGWSYGGLVLLDYALNHPENIHTLTLIEPPALWILKNNGTLSEDAKMMIDFLASVPGDKNEVTEDDLEKFLAFAGLTKPGESARQLPQWNTWVKFRQSLKNNSAVNDHSDKSSRLKEITYPVLLVKGTGSARFLHQIIDVMAMEIPNAKVVEFSGGHAPHIVSKDEFIKAIDSQFNAVK